jgi:hypothetical protein
MHFKEQSIRVKRAYNRFKPEVIVIDANGLGAGLVDYLIDEQIDNETGEHLPTFSIMNDSRYDHLRNTGDIEALYNIKANSTNNSEMHVNLATQMSSNKIHFLLDERAARKITNEEGIPIDNLSIRERAERLKPFILTTLLKDQMMNLVKKGEDMGNIKLVRNEASIGKDKFSALEYVLYYIALKESDAQPARGHLMDYINFN